MQRLKAIIFDVDGTLADTEETHRRAFNQAFSEYGLDWDWAPALYQELLAITGGKERITRYGGETLARRFGGPDDLAEFVLGLHQRKTTIYMHLLESGQVRLRPGVRRLMDEARAAGVRLSIASSSAFSNANTLLNSNLPEGWQSWFDVIETCDTVSEKKPSPAVYHAALRGLGLAPEHCCAFEDTLNGLNAARAAGLTTIVTTHEYTRDQPFPGAALVVDQLGTPEHAFTVAAGNSHGAGLVDLALLGRLLEDAAELECFEAPAQRVAARA